MIFLNTNKICLNPSLPRPRRVAEETKTGDSLIPLCQKGDEGGFLKSKIFLVLVLLLVTLLVCGTVHGITADTPVYSYKVVNVYPHDPKAFTQGIFFEEGFLYEGTGLYCKSEIRKIDLRTGRVLKRYSLPDHYFGEGLTAWKDDLIQLTWQGKKGFVYAKDSFRQIRDFHYQTEGWGLTHDDKRLIMSDGSAFLYFLDPETFKQTQRLEVSDNGSPVTNLNELEYIKGKVYANVWPTDRIAIISPETGIVEAWVDLSELARGVRLDQEEVLNGIAYDNEHDRLFVTGKLWPKLFEIQIVPALVRTP